MIGYESISRPRIRRSAADAYHDRRRKRHAQILPLDEKYQLDRIASPENLFDVAIRLKKKKDTSGPDRVRPSELTNSDMRRIVRLLAEVIQNETYHPGQTLAVPIPKSGGGKRILRIQNIAAKIVSRMLLETLSRIFDDSFLDMSYGFRPHRSVWLTLIDLKYDVEKFDCWVLVVADILKAFDSVSIADIVVAFAELMAQTEIANCSADTRERLLRLIEIVLRADKPDREIGINTGDPFSPLALNVLLHTKYDLFVTEEATKPLWVRNRQGVRYADNLIIPVHSVSVGRQILHRMSEHLLGCAIPVREDAAVVPILGLGNEPEILGFVPRRHGNELRYALSDQVLIRCREHLMKAHEGDNPPQTAVRAANGILFQLAPAYENERDLPTKILGLLADCGFREGIGQKALEQQYAVAYGRWQDMFISREYARQITERSS